MARHAGFDGFEPIDPPLVESHPRVIGSLCVSSLA